MSQINMKLVYGICLPESNIYITDKREVDGWTFNNIKIPEILKKLNSSELKIVNYKCYQSKENGGICVFIKEYSESNSCDLHLNPDLLKKPEDRSLKNFIKECQIKDLPQPAFHVICYA